MSALGDIQYGGASGTRTRLAGNTTTTKQYLTQTGNGSVSAAPAWYTPSSVAFLVSSQANSATISNSFIGIGSNVRITAEASAAVTIDYPFTVKRLRGVCSFNALSTTTTFAFRDDGADVTGATATIAAATTGEFDSGAISVAVASGSKCCFRVDSSTSAAGSMNLQNLMVEIWIPLQ